MGKGGDKGARTSLASFGVHEGREHSSSLLRRRLGLSLLRLLLLGALGHLTLPPELRESLLLDGLKRRILRRCFPRLKTGARRGRVC